MKIVCDKTPEQVFIEALNNLARYDPKGFEEYCRRQAREWDEYVEDTPEVDRQHGT